MTFHILNFSGEWTLRFLLGWFRLTAHSSYPPTLQLWKYVVFHILSCYVIHSLLQFFFLLDLLDRTDGDVLMFSKFPFSYSNKLLLTLLWLVWWMDITLNVENVLEFLSPALACSCPPSSLTLSISCLLIFRPSCLPLSVFLTNNCLSQWILSCWLFSFVLPGNWNYRFWHRLLSVNNIHL